ncbi:MAG: MFS transporter [Candidatus Nezhaarchaeales archaeon]
MSKRMIAALTLSMFIATTAMGIVNPIVPLYAKKLGATYTDLGLIGVAWSAPYCVFPILAGMWSDKVGRLKLFLVGVVSSAIFPLLLLSSSSPFHIALSRLLHGVGLSFLWAPGEALISDVTNKDERTRYLGLFSASWAMGYFLGPLLSALIVEQARYEGVFWLSFLVGIASPFALLLAGGDVKSMCTVRGRAVELMKRAVVKGLPLYVVATTSSMVIAIVYSIYPAYLSKLMFTDAEVSMFMSIIAATRALGFWSISLLPRLEERNVIIVSLLSQAIASLLITYSRDYVLVALSMAIMGYAVGVQMPPITSAISRLLEGEAGLSIGIMEAMFGIGWVVGPGVGGFLADFTTWDPAPYLFMSFASFAALLCFIHARSTWKIEKSP